MELGIQVDLLEFIKCQEVLHKDVVRKMFQQLSFCLPLLPIPHRPTLVQLALA